jgi:hypothetical protein
MLEKLGIPFNEGESSIDNSKEYPRVVFYDYMWEYNTASDNANTITVTYQISFFSKKSRDEKLIELLKMLNRKKQFPKIYHEYVEEKGKDRKYYHSYFALEIVEDLEDLELDNG